MNLPGVLWLAGLSVPGVFAVGMSSTSGGNTFAAETEEAAKARAQELDQGILRGECIPGRDADMCRYGSWAAVYNLNDEWHVKNARKHFAACGGKSRCGGEARCFRKGVSGEVVCGPTAVRAELGLSAK
ncbi:hypothetical protein O9K51_00789 [Purpureocillium lavendulum]|uniref:Uncharacterized protein n=1 Tax=Purpureocillium lavendulum TaxID=1247861 RepID=A0AB34G323_9HYPO|nr:hypothetical protein O9K51_00789 [Purpureocillium lavendulum]